ncbi:hypothetical protein BaRGS_00001682 [Batillaria attramentaria]|uniref:Uncharacterized protein n=1 Tax=Batillaria attramentaria TaxID=370345 RepID=A0ABD0M512_9CAEN
MPNALGDTTDSKVFSDTSQTANADKHSVYPDTNVELILRPDKAELHKRCVSLAGSWRSFWQTGWCLALVAHTAQGFLATNVTGSADLDCLGGRYDKRQAVKTLLAPLPNKDAISILQSQRNRFLVFFFYILSQQPARPRKLGPAYVDTIHHARLSSCLNYYLFEVRVTNYVALPNRRVILPG